ncbi:MAG: hypothetical protein GX605_07220 [Chloroflexi bacterium]|nr:hypothetical protein [Chloroflexota bacterium]
MALPWRRMVVGLALAAASALCLTLAFPPWNLGALIWVGFVPMLLAQHRVLPRRLASLAPAVTIGGWLGALLVPMFGGKSTVMAAVPLAVGALALLLDRDKRRFHEATAYRWFVPEGVVGWVGLEMARSFVPAFGTWAFVGYTLWRWPGLLQPLSLVGIYGLDLLIMLGNYALAQAALALWDRRWPGEAPVVPPRMAGRWLGATALLLALWGSLSLMLYSGRGDARPTVRVAAVQPNLPRAAHRDAHTSAEQRLGTLAAQTRQAAAAGAEVVVWPEMALGFDPQVERTAALQGLAAETGAILAIGYVLDGPGGFRNEATVLTPAGRFLGVYGKTHPAVFSGEPATVSSGTYPAYRTDGGRLATMICFDANFTDVARRLADGGAQVVAMPSLFGPSIAAVPHTQIVFRAIEHRLAVVMADVAYNSAVVDPFGRVVGSAITPEGAAATLVAAVPLAGGPTLYTCWGDWLGWLSLGGLAFFVAFIPWTLRRRAA